MAVYIDNTECKQENYAPGKTWPTYNYIAYKYVVLTENNMNLPIDLSCSNPLVIRQKYATYVL